VRKVEAPDSPGRIPGGRAGAVVRLRDMAMTWRCQAEGADVAARCSAAHCPLEVASTVVSCKTDRSNRMAGRREGWRMAGSDMGRHNA